MSTSARTDTTTNSSGLTAGPDAAVISRAPGPADLNPVRHGRRLRTIELVVGTSVPILLVAFWEIAASRGWINTVFYPSPTTIFRQIKKLYDNQHLMSDVYASVYRILYGYIVGGFGGVVAGYIMGMSRFLRAAFEPLLTILYTVPKLALISIFLVVLGFTDRPVVAVISVTVFFFVLIPTLAAVLDVPAGYREAGRSFGAGRWEMFRHVLLPASLPQVMVGLRIASGVAVLTMVGTEFAYTPNRQGEPRGLGHLIYMGQQQFVPKLSYAGIVLVSTIGAVFMWLVRRIGRLLTPWAPKDNSVA
jgi:sulfonate transport system permease protein